MAHIPASAGLSLSEHEIALVVHAVVPHARNCGAEWRAAIEQVRRAGHGRLASTKGPHVARVVTAKTLTSESTEARIDTRARTDATATAPDPLTDRSSSSSVVTSNATPPAALRSTRP